MVLRARSIGSSRLAFGNATLDAAAADRAALAAATARFRAAFRRGAKVFNNSELLDPPLPGLRRFGDQVGKGLALCAPRRRANDAVEEVAEIGRQRPPRQVARHRRLDIIDRRRDENSGRGRRLRIDDDDRNALGHRVLHDVAGAGARPCARPPFQTATRTSILESMTSLARS